MMIDIHPKNKNSIIEVFGTSPTSRSNQKNLFRNGTFYRVYEEGNFQVETEYFSTSKISPILKDNGSLLLPTTAVVNLTNVVNTNIPNYNSKKMQIFYYFMLTHSILHYRIDGGYLQVIPT